MIVTIAGMDPSVHRDFLSRIPAAGFLMLGGNLRGEPESIDVFMDAIQEGHEFPLLMTVDQEGSPIARIGGDLFPGARTLGAGDLTATAEAFAARQDLVSRAGANVNFGVVADVSQGPGAYIHSRSFSTDVAVVSEHVAVAVEARSPGVAQTLKHFPGHGMVFADSHKVVPRTEISLEAWRLSHALPFIEGIEAGAELVMTAHIRVTSVSQDPASLSNEWIALLRNELGFEGVIITDDLRMLQSSGEDAFQDPAATMVAALVAGNDLLMLAVDPGVDPGYDTYDRVLDALVEAVETGIVSSDQVDASLERILRLRAGLGAN
jgi:beta-N-acetylhexosaminidase